MRDEKVILKARFDSKLPLYWMLTTLWVLLLSIAGIPLIPIWLVVGWGVHRKQLERLECELTERSLNIRQGVFFRVEKNIPLDKITDLAMREGPILRWLGLASLHAETAGQGAGVGNAQLSGVIDAPAFRDAVLDQRDRIVATGAAAAAPSPSASAADAAVLVEIRDSLHRIEGLLGARDA